MTRATMRFGAHAAVALVSLLALAVNLEQAWLLEASKQSLPPPPRPPPPLRMPPPPPPVRYAQLSEARAATWWLSTNSTARCARVSSSRTDGPLFRQLGLELQLLCDAGATTSRSGRANSADVLLLDWETPNDAISRKALCSRAAAQPVVLPEASADGAFHSNVSAKAALRAGSALDVDVLWGGWSVALQFFDSRLRAGQMVNGMLGLEHDTLGTPLGLAQSHQRCVTRWGAQMCNFTFAPLVMRSHRDVGALAANLAPFDEQLVDLEAWEAIASEADGSVWMGRCRGSTGARRGGLCWPVATRLCRVVRVS